MAVAFCVFGGGAPSVVLAQDKPPSAQAASNRDADGAFLHALGAAWSAREKRLDSIHCSWTETRIYPPASFVPPSFAVAVGLDSNSPEAKNGVPDEVHVFSIPGKLLLAGELMRYETRVVALSGNGQMELQDYCSSFDGTSSRLLFQTIQGAPNSRGGIREERHNTDRFTVDIQPLLAYARPLKFDYFKVDNMASTSLHRLIDGHDCVLITHDGTELWIDPDCDYVVREAIRRRRDRNMSYKISIEYVRNEDSNLWRPSEWRLVNAIRDPTRPDFAVTTSAVVDAFDDDFSASVADFRLEFPDRAEVYDQRTKSFVGQGQMARDAGTKLWKTYLLLVNAIAVALIGFLMWRQRRAANGGR